MRSYPQILTFINWLFQPHQEKPTILSQMLPQYVPLHNRPSSLLINKRKPKSSPEEIGVYFLVNKETTNKKQKTIDALRLNEAELMTSKIKEIQLKNPDLSIAILMRSLTESKIYTSVLEKHHISCEVIGRNQNSKGYFFFSLLHLLRIILNPHDKLSFAGFLRSNWVGLDLTDEELLNIIHNKVFEKGYLFTSSSQKDVEDIFYDKISHLSDKLFECIIRLKKIYQASFSYLLEELLYLIFELFPFDLSIQAAQAAQATQDVKDIKDQIFLLAREIENEILSMTRDTVLKEFTLKLEILLEKDKQVIKKFDHAPSGKSILLMSIHKAKVWSLMLYF